MLAVSGDGGAVYSIAGLATARQLGLNAAWLIVDDGPALLRVIAPTHLDEARGSCAPPSPMAFADCPERLRNC